MHQLLTSCSLFFSAAVSASSLFSWAASAWMCIETWIIYIIHMYLFKVDGPSFLPVSSWANCSRCKGHWGHPCLPLPVLRPRPQVLPPWPPCLQQGKRVYQKEGGWVWESLDEKLQDCLFSIMVGTNNTSVMCDHNSPRSKSGIKPFWRPSWGSSINDVTLGRGGRGLPKRDKHYW